jgi:hypothetical protein
VIGSLAGREHNATPLVRYTNILEAPMRTAGFAIITVVVHWIIGDPAWAQAPGYYQPANEMDEDTILGFIVLALAAVGWWVWKRRRTNAQSGALQRQATPTPAVQPRPDPAPPQPQPNAFREAVGSVFISYRRGDAGDVVGRIYDRLTDRFGKPHVFKDVDSIPLGVDFRKHLADSVGKCRVFLAIISRGWLQQSDGERRIDQPNDFVRIEMEAALQRNIPVIPVLVQGASLPSEQDLPASIRELAYRNAAVVRADPDFNADIVRLMDGIAFHLTAEGDRVGRARTH